MRIFKPLKFIKNVITQVSIASLLLQANPVFATCNLSEPDVSKAHSECSAKTDEGMKWSHDLCRCINTKNKEAMRDKFLACKNIEGDQARRECMERNANEASKMDDNEELGIANVVIDDIEGGVAGISAAVAIMNFVASKDSMSGSCISRTIFSAVGLLALAAEIYFYFFLERKLQEQRQKYDDYVKAYDEATATPDPNNPVTQEEAVSKDPFTTQQKAFEFLEEEQKTVAEVASGKKTAHMIAAIGFTAAALMALLEIIVPTIEKCVEPAATTQAPANYIPAVFPSMMDLAQLKQQFSPSPVPPAVAQKHSSLETSLMAFTENQRMLQGKLSSPSIKEYLAVEDFMQSVPEEQKSELVYFFNALSLMQSAQAEGRKNLGEFWGSDKVESQKLFIAIITGVGGAITLAASESVRKWITTSAGILLLSGIEAALNWTLFGITQALQDEAEANAAKVAKVKKQFEAAVAAYCPQGRDKLEDPKCYCYTDEGKKNPNRTKSQTCIALWKSNEENLFVEGESNYFGNGDIIGCMTVNRQFDQECRCKKFVDAKTKKNACYSVPITSNSMGGLGAGVGLGQTIKDLNALGSGSVTATGLNQKELAQRAARSKDIFNQMLSKYNKDRGANKLPPINVGPKAINSFIKALPQDYMKAAMANNQLSPDNVSAGNNSDNKAIQNALKQSGLDKIRMVGGTRKAGHQGPKKKAGFNLDLDDRGAGKSSVEIMGGEVMAKKYNYKDNDIVGNADATLWQVISNRYQSSGLGHLFGDKGEFQEEKAGSGQVVGE